MEERRRSKESGRRNGDKECSLLEKLFKSEIDKLERQLLDHEKYNDARFKTVDDALDSRFKAINDALQIRTKELDHRLEGLNQLRSEVIKDREQFVRSDIFKQDVEASRKSYSELDKRINQNLVSITTLTTQYNSRITMSMGLSMASICIAGLGLIFLVLSRILAN